MQPLLIVKFQMIQFMYPVYGIRKFNGLPYNELLRNVNSKHCNISRMSCSWLIALTKRGPDRKIHQGLLSIINIS